MNLNNTYLERLLETHQLKFNFDGRNWQLSKHLKNNEKWFSTIYSAIDMEDATNAAVKYIIYTYRRYCKDSLNKNVENKTTLYCMDCGQWVNSSPHLFHTLDGELDWCDGNFMVTCPPPELPEVSYTDDMFTYQEVY